MQRLLYLPFFIAVLSLTLIGCGEKGPAATSVSITITHKGSPLAEATVTIISTDGQGHTAGGMTNSSGLAALTTQPWRGVIPGEYAVAVTKWEGQEIPNPSEESPDGTEFVQVNRLPIKYGEHSTSGFTLSVGNRAVRQTFDIVGE